jgi:thiamine-monophosphate kinase
LWNIGEKSHCYFHLNFDEIELPAHILECAQANGINPWNLFLFWGDWQVIITIGPNDLPALKGLCIEHSIAYTVLGTAGKGDTALSCTYQGESKKLCLLRNENFSRLSYNQNIKNHLDYLLKSNLFEDA